MHKHIMRLKKLGHFNKKKIYVSFQFINGKSGDENRACRKKVIYTELSRMKGNEILIQC